MNSDVKKWRREAIRCGWRIAERGGGGHEKWFAPNGRSIVTVSTTPISACTVRNLRADLRRAGLSI